MSRKAKNLLSINLPPPLTGGGSVDSGAVDDVLPPANPTSEAPINLALATGVVHSSAAPQSYINATWDSVGDVTPSSYTVQISTSSSFTASGTITATALTASAHIEGLTPGTLYYVRVRAVSGRLGGEWSDTESITTDTDTVAAGVPTSPAAAWVGTGDLLITWVNPTEANFKDVKIVVRAASGGTILRTFYSAAQHWLYTFAMNDADTSHAPDSSLYVELQSRTFSNVLSSTVNTGLVTKAAPATPTGLSQSWTGDAGTAGPDLTISWTAATDAAAYTLTLDSVPRRVSANRYTYTLDANRAEHSGTPDPAVSYSLVAVDSFGQSSTAVSGTATNAAPATPTATLDQGAVSGLTATVTSTPPADFLAYEYVFKRESTTAAAPIISPQQTVTYPMQAAADQGYHSWTVVIRQKDAFGQFSSTVTPAAVAFEALTLTSLRAMLGYSDSLGTAAATLKTAFADGVTTSGGVTYGA